MTPDVRLQVVKDNQLCFNCLLPFYLLFPAAIKESVCSVPNCGRRHTKFIHVDEQVPTDQADNTIVTNDSASSGNTSAFGSSVFLPIVPILVNGVGVNALLEKGNTNSFLTESSATKLNLNGEKHNYMLNTVSQVKETCSKFVSVTVASCDQSFSQNLTNVLVVSSIPSRYPCANVDMNKYSHLRDINIARVPKGASVDILIGMDNSHLLVPLDVRYNPNNLKDPNATKHVFGWVINGQICQGDLREMTSHLCKSNICGMLNVKVLMITDFL